MVAPRAGGACGPGTEVRHGRADRRRGRPGADREAFLQNLVTNDVARARGGLVWAALLTPQGKYLADFLLAGEPDRILLDVDAAASRRPLLQRLSMYRLRADVQLAPTDLAVRRGTGPAPAGALARPAPPGAGLAALRRRGRRRRHRLGRGPGRARDPRERASS